MRPGGTTGHTTARRTDQESGLDEKRLYHVLECPALLADGSCQAVHADRPTIETLHHGQQQPSIKRVEAEFIDFQHVQCPVGDFPVNTAV